MFSVFKVPFKINPRHILLEFGFVAVAVMVALLAIRNLSGAPESLFTAIGISLLAGLLHSLFHTLLGGYRTSWKFFSVEDANIALCASVAGSLISCGILASTVPFVGWALIILAATIGILVPHISARIFYAHGFLGFQPTNIRNNAETDQDDERQTLLMIGYGDHVVNFIRAQATADANYDIAGVVHINTKCESNSLRGVPVLGSIGELDQIVERLTNEGSRPDFLVLTRDEMSKRSVGELLSLTDEIGVPVAWLPRADRIDPTSGQQLRPIEIDDLLPRSAKLFDSRACSKLMNQSCVLVTGAGGSIGSELVRQIAILEPTKLILTDASEHALYSIDQEIRRKFPNVTISAMLLDVRDRDAVHRMMMGLRPNYVFHAAALKHVPIVEAQACEGVITNVIGSRNVADASAQAKVKAMVMVSTDKAVNPANVMGATKRLAEAYCQAMDAASNDMKGETRYITVRFGNVLGSNGSVVPLFQKQLENGGPLTVTHPDVERFFMTIPEASRLILQALLLGVGDTGGEKGIFVLDMGEPVKIVDLARQVIRLSGLKPDEDVKIVYTGLRPGEKLYEELMHETENLLKTEHPSLMVAQPRFVQIQTVRSQIDVIRSAAQSGDSSEVLRLLKLYIPEFEAAAREAKSAKALGVESREKSKRRDTLETAS